MLSRRPLLSAALACAILTAPVSVQAADFDWKFYTYFGSNDLPTQMHRAFAEDLTKATGGRLKVTVYAAGELPYKFSDVLRAVATNQVQMGDLGMGLNVGELPGLNVFDLPFLCTNFDDFFAATKAVEPVVSGELRTKYGIDSLIQWAMPPQQIWLTDPITKIEGLKGRKIRIWSRMHADMLERFGATGITITSAEVTTALQRGVADGAITAAVPAYDWKFYDVAKIGYMLNFHLSHQIVIMNHEQFGKLPKDLQAIVLAKAEEWTPKYRETIEKGDKTARKKLTASGETLVEPTEEDIAEARNRTRPLWDEWAAQGGPVASQLLASAKAACLQ